MAERDNLFSRLQKGGFLASFKGYDLNPLGKSLKIVPESGEYDHDVYGDDGKWLAGRPLLAKMWYIELTTKHFAAALALVMLRGVSGEEVSGELKFTPRDGGSAIKFSNAVLTGLMSWERNERGEEELKLNFRILPDRNGQLFETT